MPRSNPYSILVLTLIAMTLVALTFSFDIKNKNSKTQTLAIALAQPPELSEGIYNFEIPAQSVLVVDTNLNQIYYAKNISEIKPIASITKLMTAMIVLDNYNLAHPITFSPQATAQLDKNTFTPGETLKVFDLLIALLVESSNEAAYALAENWPAYDGPAFIKQEKFIDEMNRKAKEFGMFKTQFSNPSGLDDGTNASSAWDIALLAQKALSYQVIRDITTQTHITVYSEQGTAHPLENTNKLLGVISGIELGKTGLTDDAGPSITLALEKNNTDLIVVLLNAQDRFLNAQELIKNIQLQ